MKASFKVIGTFLGYLPWVEGSEKTQVVVEDGCLHYHEKKY